MSAQVLRKAPLDAVSAGCVARGQALADGGAVSDLREGQLDELLILTGLVQDGQGAPFRVYVMVDGDGVAGDCTCERAEQCEHVAALVVAARQSGNRTESPVRSSPSGAATLGSGRQSMVYLLRLSDDGRELSVCPSRRVVDADGTASATPFALTRLADTRQPDYVLEADLRILHELADRMAGVLDLVWSPLGSGSQGVLRSMLATGRCRWGDVDGPVLRLADPIRARLQWQTLSSGYQQLTLESDDEDTARQLPLLPPWRVNPQTGTCRPLASGHDDARVAELLAAGPVAPEAVAELIARLAADDPDFPRPQLMPVRELDSMRPSPRLELVMVELGSGQGFNREPAARLRFDYGPVSLAWDDEFSSRQTEDGEVIRVQRDSEFEERCAERLEQAGLVPLQTQTRRDHYHDYRPGEGGLWVAQRSDRALETWLSLQQGESELEADGWLLDSEVDFSPRLVQPDDWYGDLLSIDGQPDHFELDLGVVVNGERLSLLPALLRWVEQTPAALLRAVIEGDQREDDQVTMAVDERRMVMMPIDKLALTLRGLADFLDAGPKLKKGRLRLPRGRLAELSAAGKSWNFGGDEGLAELSRRLAEFEQIEPMKVPEGFRADLRGYQSYGLGWLQFLREFGFGGILADDMGLGKTVQALAHVAMEKQAGRLDKPCLVIAPTSLMFNWRAEAARFAPMLKVLLLHGPQRKGQFQWIDESDLVLTTYPLLVRDIRYLARHDYHLLILDEAQAIKNPRTAVSRHARELRARHRLCLTGTPLENHLGELWSLFDFLMPGMLSSASRFRTLFQLPIERHDDNEQREVLARRIRPFFLRRTKAEVAPELPPKTEMVRAVALDGAQLRLYERVRVAMHDKVRRALAAQGIEKSRIVVLDALLKLRQICCDPRLLKNTEGASRVGSAKLDLLLELVPELVAEGRRILLFSQFVGMLNLIEAELVKLGIDFVKLTGQTRDRQKVVERFQTGQVPIFLISLKAGGVGLNLTAADTVIHYDPWWNPAVEDQATDRAHRIGQDQKVFVYRLLTEQTVEQKVFELQQSKRGLVEGLLGGGGAVQLKPDDLDALFEPLA